MSEQNAVNQVFMSDQNTFSIVEFDNGEYVIVGSATGMTIVNFEYLKEFSEMLWDVVNWKERQSNKDLDWSQEEIPF